MADQLYTYEVFVDDNAHHQDESSRWRLGEFATYEAAVGACENLVDEFLREYRGPDTGAEELYGYYTSYGPDPFILTGDPALAAGGFSAWSYARKQAR